MPLNWSKVEPGHLEPEFRADVEKLLTESPYGWYVKFGFRSLSEQKVLYDNYIATGENKAAPPGRSAHNYGLAIDVVLDTDLVAPGLQPSWDIKLDAWEWLFDELKEHPRLKSGVTFQDGGHIEKYKWQNYKNWL